MAITIEPTNAYMLRRDELMLRNTATTPATRSYSVIAGTGAGFDRNTPIATLRANEFTFAGYAPQALVLNPGAYDAVQDRTEFKGQVTFTNTTGSDEDCDWIAVVDDEPTTENLDYFGNASPAVTVPQTGAVAIDFVLTNTDSTGDPTAPDV